MSIDSHGWLSWATRVLGPVEKQYSQANNAMGYVPHSAVGYYAGWMGRLMDMSRGPDGRFTPYAAASVHLWVAYDGKVTQHYPFTASCWANGNRHANVNFISAETEGGYDPHNEPLYQEQIAAHIRIIQELIDWKGWEPKRGESLLEHNECVTKWGGSPTACPSNRIPWSLIIGGLRTEEEDEMVPWLESKIIGLDGHPVKFEVLIGGPPNYPTEKRALTREGYFNLTALGLIVSPLGGAVDFLAEIAVNHEGRIKGLELPPL